MRKFIVIALAFLGAGFVYLSFGEIESILQTIRRGNLWFLLLALLIESGWILVAGATVLALYRILGLDETLYRLSLLFTAGNFISTVMPSAGMGAVAVFISEANRRGQPTGKVTIASMLYIFLDYIAFLCVLALGLIVLFRRNHLDGAELTASGIMFSIATLLGFLFYLGSKSEARLGNALTRIARLLNRLARPFIHREYLNESKMREYARELATDLQTLPQNYRKFLKPMLFALLNKTMLMCVLAAIFLAFQVPFSAGTIIGGFSIAYLFLVISPTPAGIGIVEGIMPLALSSLNVPWSQAIIVTLAYRGVTFWFPLGVGAWALRLLHIDNTTANSTA